MTRFFARLPFALRFALRDLLGDPRGFGVFIVCIVIGVAAIFGVSGLSRALSEGLAREGRTLLGGDASFSLGYRGPTPEERAFFEKRGRVSQIALMRAMARRDDGEAAMVEIKAVDPSSYPAAGVLETAPAHPLAETLAEANGVFGLIADPVLPARLDLKIGDRLMVGAARFELRAALAAEPDKLAGGVGFGPRVMMSLKALDATGLAAPGAIIRRIARVSLQDGASDAQVTRLAEDAAAAFPRAGWEVRKRDGASPQFSRNLERFSQFLTLVALTALVAGGAGVANAVRGFVERKRAQFAILKALGAPGSRVFAVALTQTLAAAALAIALGLALGAAIPFAAAESLRRAAELPVVAAFDWRGAGAGALYGFLVTLIFSLGPLGRAHEVSVAALLRDDDSPDRGPRLKRYRLAAVCAAAALAALILSSAADRKLALIYIGAAAAAFALLRGAAWLVMKAALALPRFSNARARLALANIARPKSLAPALIVSIGLTQTLLVALAMVEASIHNELARVETDKIPNFFFVDAPKEQVRAFEAFLQEQAPGARVDHVPMMRGRFVAVKGEPVDRISVADDAKWAVEGDRGVTFAAAPPKGSEVVAGAWWPTGYGGPPLVSLESKIAEGIGAAIGDEITVNVLGREIVARVASLRRLDWRTYGINFVMVFSPNTLQGAPYSELFTIAYDSPDAAARDAADARLARETAKRFPMIVAVRVKDALEAIDKIAGQLALAARAAAAVAVLTAILALASAVAAGQRARAHDAVVLKTLGATRPWLAQAYAMEFALLGAVATLIALACGGAAAYAMTKLLMKLDFVLPVATVTATALAALAFTVLLGLAGTWRVLARRPGPELREL